MAPIENEENVVLFLVTVRDISEFKEPIAENGEYRRVRKRKNMKLSKLSLIKLLIKAVILTILIFNQYMVSSAA